jgi:hypothetical protein
MQHIRGFTLLDVFREIWTREHSVQDHTSLELCSLYLRHKGTFMEVITSLRAEIPTDFWLVTVLNWNNQLRLSALFVWWQLEALDNDKYFFSFFFSFLLLGGLFGTITRLLHKNVCVFKGSPAQTRWVVRVFYSTCMRRNTYLIKTTEGNLASNTDDVKWRRKWTRNQPKGT